MAEAAARAVRFAKHLTGSMTLSAGSKHVICISRNVDTVNVSHVGSAKVLGRDSSVEAQAGRGDASLATLPSSRLDVVARKLLAIQLVIK
jgi:hypothetical protein